MHSPQLARHHQRQRGIGRDRRRGRQRRDQRNRRRAQRRDQRDRRRRQRRDQRGRRRRQRRCDRCERRHRYRWHGLRRCGSNRGHQRYVCIGGLGHNRRSQRHNRNGCEPNGRQQRNDGRDSFPREFSDWLQCRRGSQQGHPLERAVGVRRSRDRKTSTSCQQRRSVIVVRPPLASVPVAAAVPGWTACSKIFQPDSAVASPIQCCSHSPISGTEKTTCTHTDPIGSRPPAASPA